MSVVNIGRESMAEFRAGHGAVGTSPAQLSAVPFDVRKHVVVKAASDNSGTVAVGVSAAQAANGFVLAAGEETPPIYIDDVSKVWIVGSGAGQNYNWIAT